MKINERFSPVRFGQLWDFYRPGILRQWGWTLPVLLCIYLLALLARSTQSFGLFGLVNTMIVLPVYLGPIVFATYRDRALQVLLPASGVEKAMFMLLYTMVAVPLVVVASWFAIEGIFGMFGAAPDVMGAFDTRIQDDFTKLGLSSFNVFNPLRLATELVPALVCLYVVVSSRGQRVLKGIGGVVGTIVSMSFVSGLYGAYLGFRFASIESTGGDMEEAVRTAIADTAPGMFTAMSIAVPAVLLVGTVLTWRRIVKVQV